DSAAQAEDLIGQWVAQAQTPADFVVVVDRPFGDPGHSVGLAARADLIVFAFGPTDLEAGEGRLRDRLAPELHARSAAMVVETARLAANASQSSRRPVAANSEGPRAVVGQD